MTRKRVLLVATASAAALAGGCGHGSATSPSAAATVTLAVGAETFRVALTTPQQVAAARAVQAGAAARIPNGRVVAGTEVNAGWSWHLD